MSDERGIKSENMGDVGSKPENYKHPLGSSGIGRETGCAVSATSRRTVCTAVAYYLDIRCEARTYFLKRLSTPGYVSSVGPSATRRLLPSTPSTFSFGRHASVPRRIRLAFRWSARTNSCAKTYARAHAQTYTKTPHEHRLSHTH